MDNLIVRTLPILFFFQNGQTLNMSFSSSFDGCYGVKNWSLITVDKVRTLRDPVSTWTDSRVFQSNNFNVNILIEKRLRVQQSSAVCEKSNVSPFTNRGVHFSDTKTCKSGSQLSKLNMKGIRDLIQQHKLHSDKDYIIDGFSEEDEMNYNVSCGFWQKKSNELLWKNCSLDLPFLCYTGLPKYTIMRVYLNNGFPPRRNNERNRRPTLNTDSTVGQVPAPVIICSGVLALCLIIFVFRIIRRSQSHRSLSSERRQSTIEQNSVAQGNRSSLFSLDMESERNSTDVYSDVTRRGGNQNANVFIEENIYENT